MMSGVGWDTKTNEIQDGMSLLSDLAYTILSILLVERWVVIEKLI